MEPCPRSSSAWRVREVRGPVPQEAAFPSGQATPLASRRAALAKAGPFAYKTSHHGAWRSMVAHLLWEQGVAGSNPVAPTIHKNKRSAVTGWPLFVMGFSLLSAWQARNKNHPLYGWKQYLIHTKTPFRYDEVVQAHRNINGKVFLLWEPRLIA